MPPSPISPRRIRALVMGVAMAAACSGDEPGPAASLPDASPGIGFDDLRYSASLGRLLVPGGRSGRLDLVDPESLAVTSIGGFAVTADYSGGHDDGPTSADVGNGRMYVTDRTSGKLSIVDPVKLAIVGDTALAARPDYVRYVARTSELWVTEPSASQLEIFKVGVDGSPVSDGAVHVDDGPESIVVDETRGRVYTHRWHKTTLAIDVKTRAIIAEWSNGCAASRGIALDEVRGWLFSACSEGSVHVLDVAHDGRILSTMARGAGFDVMGYSAQRGHLYVAGSACACLVTLGVDGMGRLSFLDRRNAPPSTHCAAADDLGHAWVCDPDGGRVLRVNDPHPSSL